MWLQLSSLPYLQNWRTGFVNFMLIPFINLALLVLIDSQYTNAFNWSVAVAAIVIASGGLAMENMTGLFVMDRDLGIDRELLVQRPFSLAYWGAKVAAAALTSLLAVCVNLLVLLAFGAPGQLLLQAVAMVPLMIFSGIVLGFFCGVAAWKNNNPYFYLNLIGALTTIVSGALVVITKYPVWLRLFSRLFPFSQTIGFVITGQSPWYLDLAIDGLWGIAAGLIYLFQLRATLKNSVHVW